MPPRPKKPWLLLFSLVSAGCGTGRSLEPACFGGSAPARCANASCIGFARDCAGGRVVATGDAATAEPAALERPRDGAHIQPVDGTSDDSATSGPPPGPSSEPLSCGFSNPMPGGYMAGYAADTGLDIAGMGLPVFAIAAGTVDYAESGHTLWTGRGDTDRAIRIKLDEPIAYGERKITHVWYAHMNELSFEQPQGAKQPRRVAAGEYLGTNGKANGMWHLHLGLLLDGDTTQRWGAFLLEDEVRSVLCGLRSKQRLPTQPKTRPGRS